MSAGTPILCIGGRSNFEVSKVLRLTNTGLVFENNQSDNLEKMIFDSYNGKGIFKKYKPKFKEIIKFSRKIFLTIF